VSGVLLIGAVAGGGFAYWKYRQQRLAKESLVVEASARVARGDIRVEIQASGRVQPDTRLEVKPPIAGRIEEVKVEEGQTVTSGSVLAQMSSSDRAAMLDLAHAKGLQAVRDMEEVFRPTPIIAPISGTVIAQNVRRGQTVSVTDVAMILSDRPVVVAEVDETDIGAVHVGQAVRFTLDAYPDKDVRGKVEQIAYESKTVNNVTIYEVKIAPDLVPPYMRSGMTASVRFQAQERLGVLVIPTQMLRQDGDKLYVNVPAMADPTGRTPPIRKEVRVGPSDGKQTEIVSGLSEGDEVVMLADGRDQGNKAGSPSSSGGSPFMPNMRRPGQRSGGGAPPSPH
jgi:macrolide-specific efflux system membrane fusion protein